jgi:hypothetical protein
MPTPEILIVPDPTAVCGINASPAVPENVNRTNLSGGLEPLTSAAPLIALNVPDPGNEGT